ncbi:prolactin releasing hormone, isoform CRA_b [Rattus norvegicus]|uniref:Prolactin releasing hormone, isoform CRA_b n=2 Tax=Rattus norvegicus TaxID=10116 RepID=A6JQN2_RAT|nr:prolactin-releasing peptide variant [Rattus norvegicus]EDL92056.1 prolactin releasing hormone, isoform CRA_b [Rattus norvegicus]
MALKTWLLCLLLLSLVLPGASSRAHQHSMETRSECLTYGKQPLTSFHPFTSQMPP